MIIQRKANTIQLIIFLLFFSIVLSLFAVLYYNLALPYSYIVISVLIYLLLFVSYIYRTTAIYPVILIFYTAFIVSTFAVRFGMFHGDSVNDLSSVTYILNSNFVEYNDSYRYYLYPIIHIFTASLGLLVNKAGTFEIYSVAIWVPTIVSVISTLFIYLSIKLITDNPDSAFFSSIIWVSLAFVSRWLIQFTRTTMAVSFLIIFGYLLIKEYKNGKNTISFTVLKTIFLFALVTSHPVVSFFGVSSLLFTVIYKIFLRLSAPGSSNLKNSPHFINGSLSFAIFSLVVLLSYWIYVSYLLTPFINVTSNSFSLSFHSFLNDSIVGQVATSKTADSSSIAPTYLKIFGFARVLLFLFISFAGIVSMFYKKYFNSLIFSLPIFGFIFMLVNFAMGKASTTFYRTAVYSSIWLVFGVGYFINTIPKSKFKKLSTFIEIFLVVFLILPAPFFTGEVVLPSDWLYSQNPHEHINYNSGETQRFLEQYHFSSTKWINEYTPKKSLVWSDGTHSYACIKAFGMRTPTFSQAPLTNNGIDVEKLFSIDDREMHSISVNYVIVNDLMRKALYVPYGVPPWYTNYNFSNLELSDYSSRVYDSSDAAIYYLNQKNLKPPAFSDR